MSILPNVTIVSPFRDCAAKVNAYFDRILSIQYAKRLRIIAVEGDSKDNTYDALDSWRAGPFYDVIALVKCDTGRPHYGSIVNAERFRTLATVFNAGLDAVDLDWSDFVLMLPSDILYQPDLLTRLVALDKDIVAPFTWKHGIFYDTWAWSMNDSFFLNFQRQGSDLGDKPLKMTTIGGTALFRAEVLRAGVRYGLEDVDRGFCYQARKLGFTVWADPTTHVEHP